MKPQASLSRLLIRESSDTKRETRVLQRNVRHRTASFSQGKGYEQVAQCDRSPIGSLTSNLSSFFFLLGIELILTFSTKKIAIHKHKLSEPAYVTGIKKSRDSQD
jgi:hypothetical protein